MTEFEEIGNIEERHEEKKVNWKIPDFFTVAENKKRIKCPNFSFADCSWRLQLYPNSISKPTFTSVYLGKVMGPTCSVEYNFGLKKVDCSVELLSNGIFEGDCDWSHPGYIKLTDIQQRKSELAPSNVLIVTCTLKRKNTHFDQPRMLDLPKLKRLIKLDTLSENFKSLFTNKDSCDTTLHVMDKVYKAHRAVLIARSSVFAAMFQHETTEKQTGIINIPDCDPESFEEFLKFLYCGKLEEPSSRCALHLYEISDKYDVQELKAFCVEFLTENLTVKNLCEIANFGDKYDETNLLSAIQDSFNENVNEILETSEWDSLVKNNYRLSKRLLKGALAVKNAR